MPRAGQLGYRIFLARTVEGGAVTQTSERPLIDELIAKIPPHRRPRRPRRGAGRRLDAALPARYRDIGPHIELAPAGRRSCSTAALYIEEPGTEGPDVAWWFYEDHRYSVKRPIAAAGYPADEIRCRGSPSTRCGPGCWQVPRPPRRHGPQRRRGPALLPELPALRRADLPGARTRSSSALRRGLQRLDGRGVVRRERRPADPAVPRAAVGRRARRRRGAPQRGTRRAGGGVQRAARLPRAARASTLGLLGAVLPGLRRRPAR